MPAARPTLRASRRGRGPQRTVPRSPRPDRSRLANGGPAHRMRPVSDRDELLNAIRNVAVVHGDFVLSSGQRASWYVDLRRVLLAGRYAPLAGRVMLAATSDLDFDAVGGLTLGADPVAAAMMHAAAADGRDPGRLRGPQGGEGPRAAAPDRGPGRDGPPGAGRGGHLHHRQFRADRGNGPARRPGPRWPGSRCWSTGGPGPTSPSSACPTAPRTNGPTWACEAQLAVRARRERSERAVQGQSSHHEEDDEYEDAAPDREVAAGSVRI